MALGTFNSNYISDVVVEAHASTMNIDASTGVHHSWTALNTETINMTNGKAGNRVVLSITGDVIGYLITFGTGMNMNVSTFLLTALKTTVITLEHNGTTFVPVGTPLTLL